MKKTLAAIILASTVACSKPTVVPGNYVEGCVLEEFNRTKTYEVEGYWPWSEDEVRTRPAYGIRVKTDGGNYVIEFDDDVGSDGPHNNTSLQMALKVGSIVGFYTHHYNYVPSKKYPLGFSHDKIGVIDHDDITVY